ncbi:glycosyltransferase family 2 protein [Thalassomonas sp. M1454]|uniref:glycosyltransferase family 2 protein n=1 Tax=Thalassomonas sp. M1454 TaxID=2594477 RepID=UPI00117C0780|nr:glycosyltransferase [Thalassomonas sp. M1454]TRX57398.1 glycosyltransferase [Thalassomonas sp. M1454]
MNQNKPFISIIMATYNSALYVEQSIQSIIKQSYDNWELIITDDCSTDSTPDIIERYSEVYADIHVYKNSKNQGAAISRNRSLAEAKGRFIAFLDSDDIWLPSKLELQLDFMLSKEVIISFTGYELIDENGNQKNKVIDGNDLGLLSYKDLLKKKATFGCSTVLIDSSKTDEIRMPLLRTGQDYATWLSILKKIDFAHHFPLILTQYRITPGSISRNKFKKAKRQWQIYRLEEQLPIWEACYCFLFYACRAVFR